MNKAIVGYSGFVGSNITRQIKFDYKFNSLNIKDIAKRPYDLVVVAAPGATKWQANQHPEKDLENVKNLIFALKNN